MAEPSDWFLAPSERGNPATDLDRRHPDGAAWTAGNSVRVLIDGAEYFRRLYDVLCALEAGDQVWFTDWRGDPDERLVGPGTEIGQVLADLAGRGIDVRGLLWRSHVDQLHFSEQENRHLAQRVNEAGGEVLLDERVRRDGSHHQKLFVVRHARHPEQDVAFVGGIDLGHGRHDDHAHHGDPQAVEVDARYGPTPAWHDAQLELHGPALGDVAHTFRERWEDPLRLDHPSPWAKHVARKSHEPVHPHPLPPSAPDPEGHGDHAVQMLRTYPAKRPPFPFAPDGERSIARAYLKAFSRATSLIYLEDQYLWSTEGADALADALHRAPALHVIAVVPRYPDRNGRFSGPPYRIGQQRAVDRLRAAGGERVAVYDIESESGRPIYVHAKVCVVDDEWMTVGSDNLNRRSWTNDSEASCAIVDGTGRLPRETRLRLWAEHLGRTEESSDELRDLSDHRAGFAALQRAAAALDAWYANDRRGPRPDGRLRPHRVERVGRLSAPWARPIYESLVDPDGRPPRLRRKARF